MHRLAVQMNPLDQIDVASDTSIALMVEAQRRGLDVSFFEPDTVSVEGGTVRATTKPIKIDLAAKDPFTVGTPEHHQLSDFDIILIRQNPPFDMAYYANTYILGLLPPSVRIINHPQAIRNTPEKLSALAFAEYMPPTLFGRDQNAIHNFAKKFDKVVLKPLSMFGGAMIYRTSATDKSFNKQVSKLLDFSNEPIIVQKYLENVRTTDKRVMVLNGRVLGALGRLPPKGEFIANIHAGGKPVLAKLTDRETEVCEKVAQKLKEWDIFFAGLDLIDECLTEINVTSPTLMIELAAVGGPDVAKIFWDELLLAKAREPSDRQKEPV